MNSCHRSAWESYVYNMFYPGILGSMLFDLFKILDNITLLNWSWSAELLIAFVYSIDYFHLYRDLRPYLKHSTLFTFIDFSIALLFGVMYWLMSFNKIVLSFFFIKLTMLLMLVYPCPENLRPKKYKWSKVAVVSIMAISFIILFLVEIPMDQRAFWVMVSVSISYFIHVFIVTRWARQ